MTKSILSCLLIFFWSSVLYAVPIQEIIIYPSGRAPLTLTVEIADTKEERSKGLMFRKTLPEHQGMLFVYSQEKKLYMWMKQTFISLDMLFLDAKYRIVHIATHNQPHDETPVSSVHPAQYVLEINAGMAEAYGIRIGDSIRLKLDKE